MSVFRIEGRILPYAWGTRGEISRVLGRAPSGDVEAELWMGAHPLAPSKMLDAAEGADLLELIQGAPEAILGERIAARYGGHLPFLFKILSAQDPLSLQAHPNFEQARDGYAREEAAGVPLHAPHRLYHDDWHKPELLCALSSFTLLTGFLDVRESVRVLSAFGQAAPDAPLFPAWSRLRSSPDSMGLERFFTELMSLSSADLRQSVDRAVEAALSPARAIDHPHGARARWTRRLAARHSADPGVIAALLMHLVEMEAGVAVFIPAGQLHTYLGGQGLELMADSDNVIRGGLTPKHVSRQELLHVVDFQPSVPCILHPETAHIEEGLRLRVLRAPAAEFQLSFVELSPGGKFRSQGPELLFVQSGSLKITSGDRTCVVTQGAQLFCDARHEYVLTGQGSVARAAVNPAGYS